MQVRIQLQNMLSIACCVASSLMQEQERKHTNIEKTCLKIIPKGVLYQLALDMSGIISLSERRYTYPLRFAKATTVG